MDLPQRVTDAFRRRFAVPPVLLVRAPGRVNLIGEHVDYNDGFVLPMAIERAVWIALRPLAEPRARIHSLDMNEDFSFSLDSFERSGRGWGEYPHGVAWALAQEGFPLSGWEGVMASDVPIAAGLSSSAALELATARAFAAVAPFEWDPLRMALLCQKAENQWIGVNCGIMDQMISAAATPGHALLIDCRSLDLEPVPLPAATVAVVLDTATRRGLDGSAYNRRRAQCEAAAALFDVPALRDLSPARFAAESDRLEPEVRKRARHVVGEIARTLDAAAAMRRGDAITLGRLMNESHISLRDDFQVSSPELNAMAEIAQRQEGCFGARMTGAGFGGCAVALVERDAASAFSTALAAEYRDATGLQPNLYVSPPAGGAATFDFVEAVP